MLPRLICLTLASAALAAGEAVPFPHQRSELEPDPAVRWGVLENGLRYALMANEQPRDKASIRLQVQAGSLQESDPQRGLAHYLEHLAFNGTEHWPDGEVTTVLQKLGIAFGQHSNAHTSFDETVYKLDLPDAQAETIATGLLVMADWCGGMLLKPAEVEKERGIIMAEMRDRNSPGYRQRLALFSGLYPGLLLPVRFPIGEAETVAGATPELLRDFYETWYRPEAMVLAVVGAFDVDGVEAQVRERFSALAAKRPAVPKPPLGTLASAELRTLVHREPEADGTTLFVARVRPYPRPPDSPGYRRARLLQQMAERVLSRRLSEIAEKDPQGPLISASAFSYHWLDLFQVGIDAKVRPDRALDAVGILERELRRMVEHGPTVNELAVVKANLRTALEQAVAQARNRTNAQLAGALYNSVDDGEVFLSPEQSQALYAPWIDAATPADARAALADGWSAGHRLVAVTGQEDLGGDGEERVRAAWTASAAEPVAAPAAQVDLAWAYAERPKPVRSTADDVLQHEIRRLAFANRSTATLKRTDFKPGEVLVRLRLQIEPRPRQAGIDELLGRAFMAGGLGKHPLQELREVLAGTSATVSGPGFDEDGVVFSGRCLPKDLERCLQQLRAYLVDPGWRSEAEAQAKAAWMEELRSLETNLDARVGRRFQELAVHGAPHRRPATLAEAEAIGFGPARAWFEPVLARAPLTLAIVGDIDVDDAATLVASYFGSLPTRAAPREIQNGNDPGMLAEAPPLPTEVERLPVPGAVARALIAIAWQTDDFFDIQRTRRLGLLAQVLSERLRVRVREEFGQAYSPYAYHNASQAFDGFGYLGASAGVEPGNAQEARDLMVAEARALAEGGVDDALLEQVKTPVVKNLASRRQQNQYWLESVMMLAPWQPQRLGWAATMESDFASVSAAELSALAKRYLAADPPLEVIGVCLGSTKDADKPGADGGATPTP